MKPSVTLLASLTMSKIQDLFSRPITKNTITTRRGKMHNGKRLEPLPNAHGKHIDCLSGRGCGNKVSESIGICRQCRRAGVLKVTRIEAKQRKDAAKVTK